MLLVAACSGSAKHGASDSPGSGNGSFISSSSSQGSQGSSGSGSGSTSGPGSSGSGPTCSSQLASGFQAVPMSFGIPAARCQTSFQEAADDGAVSYSTIALTGGGNPDLVVYQDQCDATVGQTHWDVYAWGPTGFAQAPSPFTIPAARCQTSFNEPSQDGAVSYGTMDLTTEGNPDLVVYQDQCDSTVGQTHWDVYAWGASGFAATPTPFTVPAARCQTSFNEPAQDGTVAYGTMDLTGDGNPDLVVYQDQCDATVGQTHWDVYAWTPSGFAATPTPFTIPASRCQTSFNEPAQDGSVGYGTMDLAGDGHPDLVVFHDQCDTAVGQTHWDVYTWSASGFAATPSPFTVPAGRCQTTFDEPSNGGAVSYSTMDLTGDGHLDLLVVKDSCDTTVGQTHWDVYPWSADGFASTPTAFALPAPLCQTDFGAVAEDGSVSYAAMRLTNACSTDLVVFQDGCDSTVGSTHWEVYEQASQ